MMRTEIKVPFAHQVIADAAHHQRVVAVAQLWHKDSDRESALFAERARQQTGLIIEFARRITDALASLRRDGTPGDIVEHHGNRGGAEAQIVCENFQADRFIGGRLVILPGSHGRLDALANRMVYFALHGLHKHSLNNELRLDKAPRPLEAEKQPIPTFARSASFPGKKR